MQLSIRGTESVDATSAATGSTCRRTFLATTAALTATALTTRVEGAVGPALRHGMSSLKSVPLGFDNFSIRALEWKADQLLDFAIEQELDSLLLSDLDVYENHTPTYLATLRKRATDQGIQLHVGTGGICPTASRFIKKWGSAEEHLELGIRIARQLGSPVFRCYLGGSADRAGDGGIQRHIDSTAKVLKSVESRAVDANVKIAVENHAGDMQSWELVGLIEQAGKHFVGATIDSGNATWTLESPMANLETLGPFAVSSGIRDSTVWLTDEGARVAWNAIGDGQVDWAAYSRRFAELCPDVPFQLEIISGFSRLVPFRQAAFWADYPLARAHDYESFLEMARAGKEIADGKSGDAEYQKSELLKSIRYCRSVLGLGRRTAK